MNFHIYCDFDGTIATVDVIGEMLKRFAPETASRVIREVHEGKRTIQDGVEEIISHVPATEYANMQTFTSQIFECRPGLEELITLCRDSNWPFTVVSGGFDFFVEPALGEYQGAVEVVCNQIDASGTNCRVVWHTSCDEHCEGGCGLCKPTVLRLRNLPSVRNVVIGDGITDAKIAAAADVVFARDRLGAFLDTTGQAYYPFQTFFDVAKQLQKLAEESEQ